jgi:hypothetical protein
MNFRIKYITSLPLLAVFFYFSSGIIYLPGIQVNQKDICQLQKSCKCCSSGAGACCCVNLNKNTIRFALSCNHPGFEGKDYTLDPTKIESHIIIFVFISDVSYSSLIPSKFLPDLNFTFDKPPSFS